MEYHRHLYLEPTYYEENRDRVLAKARRKIQCPCGAKIQYSSKWSHQRGMAHTIWEKSQGSKIKIDWTDSLDFD